MQQPRYLYSFIEHDLPLNEFETETSIKPNLFKSCYKALLFQALYANKEHYFHFIENKINQLGYSISYIEMWSWIHSLLIEINISAEHLNTNFTLLAPLFSKREIIDSAKQYPLGIIWPTHYRFYRKISETCDPETILFWCNYQPNPMPKRISLLFHFIRQNNHTAIQTFDSAGLISSLFEYPKEQAEFPFIFFIHEENLDFILQYFPLLDLIEFLKLHMTFFASAENTMDEIRKRCATLLDLPKDLIFMILDIHPNKKNIVV